MGVAGYHEAIVQRKCSRVALCWWIGEACLCFWVTIAVVLGACGTAFGVTAWREVEILKVSLSHEFVR